MKYWLIGLGSLLFSCSLTAQITLSAESFPRVGDTLYTAVDNLPSNVPITPAGGNQRWDFTGLQAPFARRTLVQYPGEGVGAEGFPESDQMIQVAENLEAYFRATQNAFELLGYFGVDPLQLGIEALTRFEPPIPERRAPLNFLDTHQSESNLSLPFSADELPSQILNQLPIRPDSLRIRIRTQREDVVDAWGTLTIPGGIYDVLREKRTETRDIRLDAKIGFLPWQDITNIVPDNEQLGSLTTIRYYYLSNEAKEPIAIVYMDEAEVNVLRVEYKANDITTNVQSVANPRPGIYAFPNPAIVNVRFEFSNLPAGDYKLSIFNILGVEQWSQTFFIDGSRTEKVNISNLRKGTYLYSLSNEKGRTLVTKRLIVIKP